ncbi:SET and MYND domain-containing protein 4 [Colias croceus]|uniref:SET and MYND domain-containing protein 4 n=1 Tax=Colias crocea TaxID=72248 RepID=UPI001E28087D|nr:SET and MYND domain-containing protein 4 [Colias croceus]
MIIDVIYADAINKLTSQGKIADISRKLLVADNNSDRVLLVYDVFEESKFFPSILQHHKSEKVSTHYRNLGNQCYQKKDHYKAWQYYNLSFLYAPLDSESYALALSNRSAVFFSLDKYAESLQDIEHCFSLNYPEKVRDKLIKRKELCKEALSSVQDEAENPEGKDILTFKGEKSERYVGASTKLEVVYNKEMGRHVVAKEDIRVGEVLVEEQPYFALLLKQQLLFGCSYCLSRKLNLIPCKNCCFALYCNEECSSKAWKEYHEVECPLMATLVDMNFTKLELLALRTVIKARTDHPDWESLYKTIEEAESNVDTEFHGHVKVGDKWVYDSKYYASIHTLATNVERRSISDIFQKSVTAAVFLKFLLDETNFMDADTEEAKEKIWRCVAGLLLLHSMTSPTNMHGISANTEAGGNGKFGDVNIASAPYAFHSLINHSCAPNVVRYSQLGTSNMTLFALRPIKKGMQLYDNYGSHHAIEDRMVRQTSLQFQYKFMCMCEACVNNWPTYLTMRQKKIPPKITRNKNKFLSYNIIDKLQHGDKETAIKIFRKLCSLCEELESYAPCIELCDCQEGLKQCLVIMEGILPYGCNESVDWQMNVL